MPTTRGTASTTEELGADDTGAEALESAPYHNQANDDSKEHLPPCAPQQTTRYRIVQYRRSDDMHLQQRRLSAPVTTHQHRVAARKAPGRILVLAALWVVTARLHDEAPRVHQADTVHEEDNHEHEAL
jgi:hypothetical protein